MTTSCPNVSERLALTFATWQMYFFCHEIEVAMLKQQGRATNAHMLESQKGTKLPHVILNNQISHLNERDWQPLVFSGIESVAAKQLNFYENFPRELFQWNRTSRRVFHLPHSLEVMLASAEFPDMVWGDILWPFDSFIITVEKPIVVRHPGGIDQVFDTIMVTKGNTVTGERINLRWIQTLPTGDKKLGLNVSEVERFRNLLKKGRISDALMLWEKRIKEIRTLYPLMIGSQVTELEIRGSSEKLITEAHELFDHLGGIRNAYGNRLYDQSTQSFYEALSVSLRLTVGLMLYLETISKESAEWQSVERKKAGVMSGGSPSIITQPENICFIVGKGRIDPSEVTADTGRRCDKGFVRPHWRRAHYRRSPGSALDAPKTHRIPPVLVRADLVPLYGIIGGTSTVLISEE